MTYWRPFTPPATSLVWPVRLDPTGCAGPTRVQARTAAWRRCARGWYVPATADGTDVEQRILEQAVRVVDASGALAGWAALRWRGAAYFDGRSAAGDPLPVPLVRRAGGASLPPGPAVFSAAQLGSREVEVVRGVPCTTVARSLFDVMRFSPSLRRATVAADMTIAAGLLTTDELAAYVERHHAWEGVPLAREAVALARDSSMSPQESWMRLCWVLDAGLPDPVCNRPVFDLHGRLLGYPDLLDVEAGVVGEYDGAHHRETARRSRDIDREAGFREAGLEYFSVVAGELRHRAAVAERMTRARERARRSGLERRWTLTPPPWWESAEQLLGRRPPA